MGKLKRGWGGGKKCPNCQSTQTYYMGRSFDSHKCMACGNAFADHGEYDKWLIMVCADALSLIGLTVGLSATIIVMGAFITFTKRVPKNEPKPEPKTT